MANNPFDPPIVQVRKSLSRGGLGTVNRGFGSLKTTQGRSRPAPSSAPATGWPENLSELVDVDTSTTPPADGDLLSWDESLGLWVPATPETGGGGVLASPDGSTWELVVDNTGALSTSRLTYGVTYLDLLNDAGVTRYWDLTEPSGNFLPRVGTDPITVDAGGLARNTDGPFGTGDGTMTITSGNHHIPKAELGTTTWTWQVWVFGGGGSGYRAIIGGGGAFRFWYLNNRRLHPYGFSWNGQQGPTLSEERWYMITVSSDPSFGVRYWLDDSLVFSHGTAVETTTHATAARLGTNDGGGETFSAKMAHLATWNRALDTPEVETLYGIFS